ncbi:MAG: hypothetical protein NVS9B1_13370 [Candidatus Dormibacteraceae bacterium]
MTTMTAADPWIDRRRRAAELRSSQPHAADLLDLFGSLAEVSSAAFRSAAAAPPALADIPALAVRDVLPGVLDATLGAGPAALREAAVSRFHEGDLEAVVAAWLGGEDQAPIDRYLARAAAGPILEAAPAGGPGPDDRHCPACGGLPQLSWFGTSGEALVTAPRQLLCSRCAGSWIFPRMVCAGCGSDDTTRMPIYADVDRFPGMRVDACEVCQRYLLTIELTKQPDAVPIVDELTALPLDLYARERGFSKIAANLMGF